jgi:hypothetical protein
MCLKNTKPTFSLIFFKKEKSDLWDHQSVCNFVSPANNFWTNWQILIKFNREVKLLNVTSVS